MSGSKSPSSNISSKYKGKAIPAHSEQQQSAKFDATAIKQEPKLLHPLPPFQMLPIQEC